MEELGLFWKRMPSRTRMNKEEKSVSGFKALMVAVNLNPSLFWFVLERHPFSSYLFLKRINSIHTLKIHNGLIILMYKRYSFLISCFPDLLPFPNWYNIMVSPHPQENKCGWYSFLPSM